MRSVVEARTGDAVLVVSPDYRIVHWDDRMETLTGVLAEEAQGEHCFRLMQGEGEGGDIFCASSCAAMRLAKEGRPVSNFEMRIDTRLGEKRWVSVTNLTVETEEGAYLVHFLRDSQGDHDALEMARALIELSSREDGPSAPKRQDIPALSPRQLQVLELLSEGKSVKEMAGELYLSEATVRNHVRSLLQTLGAHSQLEVLAKAHRMGLLTS